jgi:hypothetical protein
MLLNDLSALGRSIVEIPELAPTAALYGAQYHVIEHVSTSAFMGWVAMLEGFASRCGPNILARVIESHGEDAAVFLKVHSVEDQVHIEKAMRHIDSLPLEHQGAAVWNFKHSAYFYKSMLVECSSKAAKNLRQAA